MQKSGGREQSKRCDDTPETRLPRDGLLLKKFEAASLGGTTPGKAEI